MISVQKIEQLCQDNTLSYEPEYIFQQFISDNPIHFNLRKSAEKMGCNQEVTKEQLEFQCSSCSNDQQHIICSYCFIISNYHNQNQQHNNSIGKCQCRNSAQDQSFCQNIQKKDEKDNIQQKEILSIDLAEKIEQFIITVCSFYNETMKQIEIQWTNFRQPIMELYHLCCKFKIDQLIQTIDNKINYYNYYNLLLKSQYLHQLIFTLIDWLTQDRKLFQILIAYIFQKQLPNRNYSVYECLLKFQVLQETTSPEYPIFIGKLIERLTLNFDFFEFATKVNLRIYSSFFLLAKNSQTNTLNQIYEYIDELTQLQEDIDPNYVSNNENQINEFQIILENYLQELKQFDFTSQTYIECEAIGWFRASLNEIIMKIIIEELDQIQVFSFIESAYCLIHQPLGQLTCYPWNGIKFFGSRFRCEQLDKFNMSSLKKALGKDFDKFKNQNADFELIKNFKYEKQLLTKLLNCFIKAQLPIFPQKTLDYKLTANEDQEIKFYMNFEGEIFKEIETGIISLFSDIESTDYLKQNFIQVILVQTYKLIKNSRNIGLRFDTQLAQIFSNQINQNDDETIKIFKARKIYCYLKKNATILDKIFIKALCLHLSMNEYLQPQDLLLFLETIFDDKPEIIKENFQQILQRCIQNYVTVWMMIDDNIDQFYYGFGENNYITKLESIDTAFGKLYLYLFGEVALLDIYRAIQNMQIPDITYKSIIINQYLMRILTSDIDIYNLSISSFCNQENLPILLQQALLKILQNIMNFESLVTYQQINLKFEELGIVFPKNAQLLKFLDFDEKTKLYQLKKQYPPLYDPILYAPKEELKNLLIEKLNERGLEDKILLFGNGLLWSIKQFNQEKTYRIQKHILNTLSSLQNILDILQFSSQFNINGPETSNLLYYLLIAASYFRPQDLATNKILILQHLHKIYNDSQNEIIQQHYAIIIEEFKNCTFLNETQYHNFNDQELSKVQLNQIQAQTQQIQEIQQSDQIVCNYCNLQINDKYYVPILLTRRSPKIFQNLPEKLESLLISQDFNLLQVSVNGCQHRHHSSCVIIDFQSQLLLMQYPPWFKQSCQICKQSFNVQLPLHKQLSQLDVQFFNKALVDSANESGLWNYLIKSNQNQNQNIILELYYQIIIDLIQQIFIDINRFRQSNRTIIFNQIIYLFEQTLNIYQNSVFKIEPKIYKFDKDISIIFDILNSIQNNIIINQNRESLKEEISLIISKLNSKNDLHKQTLLEIFDINKLEFEQYQTKPLIKLQQIDPYIQFQEQIFEKYKEKLQNILDQNLAEFHKKYSLKGCDICKNDNTALQQNNELLVCLICEKVFCIKQCTYTKFGNLNEHALQVHAGGSFYASLITGSITLVQHPISLYNVYHLFNNEKIDLKDMHQQSNKVSKILGIDPQILSKIVETIIYNQYGLQICYNQNEKKIYITTDGGL